MPSRSIYETNINQWLELKVERMAEDIKEFLTVNELAERWRCNTRNIYRQGKRPAGFPKAIRLFGGKNKKILFRMSDVIEYEKSCES